MENNSNPAERKVTKKQLFTTFVIIVGACIVLYFRETGEVWAKVLFAILMLSPLVYFLYFYMFKMSDNERSKIAEGYQEASNARPYKLFKWGIYLVVGATVILLILLNKTV